MKDKSTMPESFDKIHFERQEIRSRECDGQFVDGAWVTDLDLTLLQSIAGTYIKGLSVELYLQQTGLAIYGTKGVHESRNPLIARVLKENKLMRELGEGMKRIFSLMNENNMERPVLYSNASWFKVTLSKK
ncbi:MAG: hypothetical protein LBG45_12555 [Dysgonamonadaceae bacterium]|jgi:hypothetical protein|nr:hypothetical protein [Dysgonamonadaceae bacterium]